MHSLAPLIHGFEGSNSALGRGDNDAEETGLRTYAVTDGEVAACDGGWRHPNADPLTDLDDLCLTRTFKRYFLTKLLLGQHLN